MKLNGYFSSKPLIHKILTLNNLGGIYKDKENYVEALRWAEESLQILDQLGLSTTPMGITITLNVEYLKDKVKK